MSLYVGNSNNTASLVAGATGLRQEYTFRRRGFVSTSQPLSPLEGDIWINSSSLPTTFPVTGVKIYSNGSWINSNSYTPAMFDMLMHYNGGYTTYYWDSNQSKWMKFDDASLYVKGTVTTNAEITVTNLGAMSSSDFETKKNSIVNNSLTAVWD